jgi:outer membrane protein OmpA-like peptidoglycan-associated protein
MIYNKKMMMTGLLLLLAGPAYAAPTSPAMPQNNFPVTLISDSQDVVHDEVNGSVIHSTSGACVRTKWMSPSDICAPAEPPPTPVAHVAPPPPPPPPPPPIKLSREERTVYFVFNKDGLTPEMKQRLDTLAAKLKSDKDVKGARIIGYADRIGHPDYNEKLSKKRAENVSEYLIAKGIINTKVADTRWLGATTPITDCSSKLKKPKLVDCLQPDRRVEVEIDYFPEVQPAK